MTITYYHPTLDGKGLGLDDPDLLKRSVTRVGSRVSNPVNNIHAVDDLSKDSVLSVQVRRGSQSNEELAAVGGWTAVGHGQDTLARVDERAVKFILKLAAVDGLSTTTSTGWVTTLNHEVGNDAVEDDAVVFACIGEAGKVSCCLQECIR